jgi:hypothetical protein
MTPLDKIKKQIRAEFPTWTDAEVSFLAEEMLEVQSVIEADLTVALDGKPVTLKNLRDAAIASGMSLKK